MSKKNAPDPSVPCDPFQTMRPFRGGHIFSLPALAEAGFAGVSRLPVSLRIVLESVLRNCDGARVRKNDVEALANWNGKSPEAREIPFVVSRVVLQDFTGVPLLVDLAAMREAVAGLGRNASLIEPLVPVDLVIDHSVQVDRSGTARAFADNLRIEFGRNRERYEFLKWGQQAFDTFKVVPPAVGIVHQVNLEYLARLVFAKDGVYFPDSLVGTDSHTTMINGLGIVGWGVGGIEAEAGMLGQPVAFPTPEVVGVHLTGALRDGVTATDLVLRITELLRAQKVVGKFVEFFGTGAASLPLADRATIANMAPEYGATMGYFPIDEKTLDYLRITGRDEQLIDLVREYYTAQGLFGVPVEGDIDYSEVVKLDLSTIVPCVAGPKRPQDRIDLPHIRQTFDSLLEKPVASGGYGIPSSERNRTVPVKDFISVAATSAAASSQPDESAAHEDYLQNEEISLRHGSVLIAAITSCTNTSNPSVMLAAGLVAQKALAKGLRVPAYVKTSLAPGSRVVTDYLRETGLDKPLDALGFQLVGYGCTTCIGNSGPLDAPVEAAIEEGNLITASVLSGNRNFEARIHSAIKANFLMSPPLVVAFALAGRIDIDLDNEALGTDTVGQPVFLRDLWPTREEIEACIAKGLKPQMFTNQYSDVLAANPQWREIPAPAGERYEWTENSTYIQLPPFFADFKPEPSPVGDFAGMRALGIFGDSVTTDHISPAGDIPEDGPAGRFLVSKGVSKEAFNSFGSRRGNDRIMTRGTFANVRIKNRMANGKEGGYTTIQPENRLTSIFEAAEHYASEGTALIVFGGVDYGMGSSRDWAAKGTALLGVKIVVAKSFERIHRSNLIGMGVLPCVFQEGEDATTLGLDGTEVFSIEGLAENLAPRKELSLTIHRLDGSVQSTTVTARLDTGIEVEYYRQGGILHYVLRSLLQN